MFVEFRNISRADMLRVLAPRLSIWLFRTRVPVAPARLNHNERGLRAHETDCDGLLPHIQKASHVMYCLSGSVAFSPMR